MANTPFTAVLLAGGRSRRMGRDKALLPLPDGRLLWQRQLAVLEALAPAEIFISGPAREGFPTGITLLTDEKPGLGPLAGIAAALEAMDSPLLVVLAIDLPAITAGFLRGLLAECHPQEGLVPRRGGTGYYEPLAAVYPRACLALAGQRLQDADRSLQSFVRAAGPLLRGRDITPADEALFLNWNEPADSRPAFSERAPAA